MEIEKGDYKHYKGNMYKVYTIAQHSETEEWMVVYKAMYGDENMWVRPYAMFVENIEIDGVTIPRFKKVADAL